jgi:hypothetical protein
MERSKESGMKIVERRILRRYRIEGGKRERNMEVMEMAEFRIIVVMQLFSFEISMLLI